MGEKNLFSTVRYVKRDGTKKVIHHIRSLVGIVISLNEKEGCRRIMGYYTDIVSNKLVRGQLPVGKC